MDNEHITFRRERRHSNESINSSFISMESNTGRLSLPDLSTIQNNEIEELKSELTLVIKQLDTANQEIKQLKQANEDLQKQIFTQNQNIEKIIRLYPELSHGSSNKTEENMEQHLSSTFQENPNKQIIEINKDKNNSLLRTPPAISSFKYTSDGVDINMTSSQDFEKSHEKQSVTTEQNKINEGVVKAHKKHSIFILGGNQCTGLASVLLSSRERRTNHNFSQYNICSFVKPNANAEEILKMCYTLSVNKHDYVVICVGENDRNPTHYMIELSSALKYLQGLNANVILLNVTYNSCLNENKLNNLIKNVSQYFPNCTYIELYNPRKYYYCDHKKYLHDICFKINNLINLDEYKSKFLTFKACVTQNNASSLISTKYLDRSSPKNIPAKGTIPYYFKKMGSNAEFPVCTNNPDPNKQSVESNKNRFFRAQSI